MAVHRTEFGTHGDFVPIGIADLRGRKRKLGCTGPGWPDLD
jgi:hypothetical protein